MEIIWEGFCDHASAATSVDDLDTENKKEKKDNFMYCNNFSVTWYSLHISQNIGSNYKVNV